MAGSRRRPSPATVKGDTPAVGHGVRPTEHNGLRWLALTGLVAGVTALVLGLVFWWPHDDADLAPEPVLSDLAPDQVAGLVSAAEEAARDGDTAAALELFLRVPQSAGETWVAARFAAADLLRQPGRLDESILLLEETVRLSPESHAVRGRLATYYKLTGRSLAAWRESRVLAEAGAVPGGIQPNQLLWLANPERFVQSGDLLPVAVRHDPRSLSGRLGLAARAWSKGDPSAALEELSWVAGVVEKDPDGLALQGAVLRERGDASPLAGWLEQLPPLAQLEHPEIWRVLGEICEDRGATDAALRAYLECVSRHPDHRVGCHKGGRLLVARGMRVEGTALLRRAEQLRELAAVTDRMRPEAPDTLNIVELAERLVELDRPREAALWLTFARPEGDGEPARRITRLRARLEGVEGTTEVLPVARQIRERFPLPDVARLRGSIVAPATKPIANDQPRPTFVDEAAAVGIDFTYREGRDAKIEGRRMPEFTGGGVAVLDYDLDGSPDLCFTQGGDVPVSLSAAIVVPVDAPGDRLFAGGAGGSFRDITGAARFDEPLYSQGVAAGDVNNDGFPDLYVANFGPNRLFLNRGDGTFARSDDPVFEASSWSTSVAIADLNGDGHPDLFDVNYVQGPEVATLRCPTAGGPRVCAPRVFDAADDRVLLSRGDGTFQDVSASANIHPPGGKGLGLLIGPLREAEPTGENVRPLEVFVANDTEANFLLVPGDSTRDLVYDDLAITTGSAYGADGRAQACMGVASGDFDADGRLDLFVTNYFNEPNALYLGRTGGLFEDRASAAGLSGPSLPMLGFGTQALDVDLDGDLDLVVANGDLDDFLFEGREFRMRPQLFLNDGRGRFEEHRDAAQGDYFARLSAHRGRGLARLDWNRDGLPDFAVSHLDEPSALVTNRTTLPEDKRGWIGLRIVATTGARDATGATVELLDETTGQRITRAWWTAGDGYQASNERRLVLGVGEQRGPFRVEVRFVNGRSATHTGIRPASDLLVIEGREGR